MQEKKRRAGAARLNFYHQRALVLGSLPDQRLSEMLDRRLFEQSGERQLFARGPLDAVHHFDGQQRMSAKIEKVVTSADRTNHQKLLPYLNQLALQLPHRRRI